MAKAKKKSKKVLSFWDKVNIGLKRFLFNPCKRGK